MINIRNAEREDLPEILEIYNDVIINTTAVYDYEPHTLDMRQRWFEGRRKEGYPVFVATKNKTIVGFSSLGPFRAWAAYKYTAENSLYVAADSRGKGIGRLLMQPLIQSAIKLNLHTILAGIDSTNAASIYLHQSFGFKEVANFKEVGYKFDRWLDLVFLQLLLPSGIDE